MNICFHFCQLVYQDRYFPCSKQHLGISAVACWTSHSGEFVLFNPSIIFHSIRIMFSTLVQHGWVNHVDLHLQPRCYSALNHRSKILLALEKILSKDFSNEFFFLLEILTFLFEYIVQTFVSTMILQVCFVLSSKNEQKIASIKVRRVYNIYRTYI